MSPYLSIWNSTAADLQETGLMRHDFYSTHF